MEKVRHSCSQEEYRRQLKEIYILSGRKGRYFTNSGNKIAMGCEDSEERFCTGDCLDVLY